MESPSGWTARLSVPIAWPLIAKASCIVLVRWILAIWCLLASKTYRWPGSGLSLAYNHSPFFLINKYRGGEGGCYSRQLSISLNQYHDGRWNACLIQAPLSIVSWFTHVELTEECLESTWVLMRLLFELLLPRLCLLVKKCTLDQLPFSFDSSKLESV